MFSDLKGDIMFTIVRKTIGVDGSVVWPTFTRWHNGIDTAKRYCDALAKEWPGSVFGVFSRDSLGLTGIVYSTEGR